jgi:chondroitin 4-sulfotransferase 11
MIITDKYLFIHIPKCAGKSIGQMFASDYGTVSWNKTHDREMVHGTLQEIKESHSNVGDRFIFTFIRNPFERVVSSYAYLSKRIGVVGTFEDFLYKRAVYQKKLTDPSLKKVVEILLDIRPCYDYLCDEHGRVLIDFIGRFEQLQQDFDLLRYMLHLDLSTLKHKNKSIHKQYKKYYNQQTREFVQKRFEMDLDHFKYSF